MNKIDRPPMDITVNHLRDLYDSSLSQVQRLKKIVRDDESETKALQAELDAANAHIVEFRKMMGRLTMCCDLEEYEGMACELMARTPAQSLASVQAAAINTMLDEVPLFSKNTMDIYEIEAYANKLKAGPD